MRFFLSVVVLALNCVVFASAGYEAVDYGTSGYASVGYGTVGYASRISDSLTTQDTLLVESAEAANFDSLNDNGLPLLPAGDGSLGYRASIQSSWLNFVSEVDDENFKELTGVGFSFGGYKSFGINEMFEVIPGADIDARLIWGNYRFVYRDEFSEEEHFRLGGLFTVDLRAVLLFRLNLSIFYVEAGPQLGFNIVQSAMVKFEDYFDYSQEDLAIFIFSVVPGVGFRLDNLDFGIRFVPDITDCWKRSKASMVSVQFAVTFWQ